MRRVVFLPSGQRDLDEIWSFIAEHDMNAADRMVDRLRQATRLLADQPYAGVDVSDLRPYLRKWPVSPYIIFYALVEEHLQIIRVLHGARDRRHLSMS